MIPFGRIINETLQVAGDDGSADLCRLYQAVGYWAPEVKESWFWYGRGGVLGYLDILNNYFRKNEKVRSVYMQVLEKYYKDNTMQE